MIGHVYDYLQVGTQRDERTEFGKQQDALTDGQANEQTDDEAPKDRWTEQAHEC